MGGLPPRRSDEEKLIRTAEAAVEAEAHRVEASADGARARIQAYVDDIYIEERPTDDDLRALLAHDASMTERFRNQMDAAMDLIARAEKAERERDKLRVEAHFVLGILSGQTKVTLDERLIGITQSRLRAALGTGWETTDAG